MVAALEVQDLRGVARASAGATVAVGLGARAEALGTSETAAGADNRERATTVPAEPPLRLAMVRRYGQRVAGDVLLTPLLAVLTGRKVALHAGRCSHRLRTLCWPSARQMRARFAVAVGGAVRL